MIWPRTRSAMKAVRPKKVNGSSTKPASVTSLNSMMVTKTWIASTKKAMTTISQEISKIRICTKLVRSEEHTSELQSLMRITYAVFCWQKKIHKKNNNI